MQIINLLLDMKNYMKPINIIMNKEFSLKISKKYFVYNIDIF